MQVGMPPYTYHMDQSIPTQQMMQPMMPNRVNQPMPITDQRLPPTTILAPSTPTTQHAENQSCAEEGWLDDEKFGAEDKAPNPEYTFCGVDFKPVLPVALALSTVLGGICMTLLQIPMLSRFTFLPESGLLAGFCVLYAVSLASMAWSAFADPGQMKKTRNLKNLEVPVAETRVSKKSLLVKGKIEQQLWILGVTNKPSCLQPTVVFLSPKLGRWTSKKVCPSVHTNHGNTLVQFVATITTANGCRM